MKNDTAAVEIPDFARTNINHWSVKCPETLIYAYFKYLRGHLEWFETDGKVLLEQTEPLTKEQFTTVMDHMHALVTDISKLKPLNSLLQIALKKGISSLASLVEGGQIGLADVEEYLKTISYYLEAGGPCGINSHECSSEDSAAMIDSLIPIAQACKDESMLSRIARCRFPGRNNGLPREIFEKHFMNWPAHVKVHVSNLGPYGPQNPKTCIVCGKVLDGVAIDEPCNGGKPTQ